MGRGGWAATGSSASAAPPGASASASALAATAAAAAAAAAAGAPGPPTPAALEASAALAKARMSESLPPLVTWMPSQGGGAATTLITGTLAVGMSCRVLTQGWARSRAARGWKRGGASPPRRVAAVAAAAAAAAAVEAEAVAALEEGVEGAEEAPPLPLLLLLPTPLPLPLPLPSPSGGMIIMSTSLLGMARPVQKEPKALMRGELLWWGGLRLPPAGVAGAGAAAAAAAAAALLDSSAAVAAMAEVGGALAELAALAAAGLGVCSGERASSAPPPSPLATCLSSSPTLKMVRSSCSRRKCAWLTHHCCSLSSSKCSW